MGSERETPARAAWLEVDLDAIEANARAVKNLVGPECEVMAVVKADGYGLGARQVAHAALDGGASRLAVALADEGVALRQAGFTCPILIMSYTSMQEAERTVRHNLTATIHRERQAQAFEAAAVVLGVPKESVPVHIKVDTGLGRYGCLPAEALPLARAVSRCTHLRLEGLMTHFATADSEDISFARDQLAVFDRLMGEFAAEGIRFPVIHASNSAATLGLPEARFNAVRVGILLSGTRPSEVRREPLDLEPVVAVKALLVRVFPLAQGATVGYGRTWTAPGESTAGLVPLGYADGYRRAFSNRAEALVHGRRCPVIGRVSMDQVAIDVTGVGDVAEGDEVVLLGAQGNERITVDEWAGWADTISYEMLCGLGARLPRRYRRGGRVETVSPAGGMRS